MIGYDFQVELKALHKRIAAEHNLEVKYIPARNANVRPLVILLENSLPRMRADTKRALRLGILSLWIGENVKSSYDLTIYQCSTILDFLEYNYQTFAISQRARRFLEDSAQKVENGDYKPAFGIGQDMGTTHSLPDL